MKSEDIIKKLKPLEVYVLDGDIRIYYKYMNLLSDKAKVIDLGTGWGKSVIAMALCCDSRIPIDTFDNGSYPVAMKWCTFDTYLEELEKQFKKYGASNINPTQRNLLYPPHNTMKYDLLHLDIMQEAEVEVLERWLKVLKHKGYGLIRNYNRHKEKFDELLKGYEYLEYDGLIQVVRKP